MLIKKVISRRSVLRGALGGLGVTVGLPLLDVFLNDNGSAFANGNPLPVRFGTWYWMLGMEKSIFTPKKFGTDYDLPPQIASWKDIKQHVNLFSNYNVTLDGRPALCHYSGGVALRCGTAPSGRGDLPAPSIDVLAADAIGEATRFRSLDCTSTGSIKDSMSFRSSDLINPADASPMGFYQKIFGDEFQDPNSDDFKPSVSIMVQKSVLSGVQEQSSQLLKKVGAADRMRLDQYFTSLRELEQSLVLQLQKPPPAPSCNAPSGMPVDMPFDNEVELVQQRYKSLTDMLVMAVACNQTRVFNMFFTNLNLTKVGQEKTHHTLTHEEPADPALGYQPLHNWFTHRSMEAFAHYVRTLASVKEGAGTLLDNCLIYAHSEHEYARTHSVSGIPMMTAGRAGGRLKTGFHIDGKGESPTQVGLTVMNAIGLPVSEWGSNSLKTSRVISQILA